MSAKKNASHKKSAPSKVTLPKLSQKKKTSLISMPNRIILTIAVFIAGLSILFLLKAMVFNLSLLLNLNQGSKMGENLPTEPSLVLLVDPITHEFYDMEVKSQIKLVRNPSSGMLYLTETTFTIDGARVNGINQLFASLQRNPNNQYNPNQFKTQFGFSLNTTGYPRFTSEKIILVDGNCIDLYSDASRIKTTYIATFCYKQTSIEPGKQFQLYSNNASTSVRGTYTGSQVTIMQTLSTLINKYDWGRTDEIIYATPSKVNFFTIDTSTSTTSNFKNVIYSLDARGIDQNNTKDYGEWCYNFPNPPYIYMKQGWGPRPEGGSNYRVSRRSSGGCGYEVDMSYLVTGFISLYKDGYTYNAPFPTVFPYPAPTATLNPIPTTHPAPPPISTPNPVPVTCLKGQTYPYYKKVGKVCTQIHACGKTTCSPDVKTE